jgi:uncharacterized protein (TIGR02145 family)
MSRTLITLLLLSLVSFSADPVREVRIGHATWMATNLDVTRYRNGDAIPQVTDPEKWKKLKTGAWCWYNNDQKNGQKYGRLYNWYAVNDKRGLGPKGWHVATRKEWDQLAEDLGGPDHAAKTMKEKGTWKENGDPYDNSSGFSARAGGGRYNGRYLSITFNANFWTADDSTATIAHARFISASADALYTSSYDKPWGYSVRCVKD